MIVYDRLFKILMEKELSSYTLTKRDKIIGGKTFENLQEGKNIDTRTINALCQYLQCQPGDIMEYVPDDDK